MNFHFIIIVKKGTNVQAAPCRWLFGSQTKENNHIKH